MQTLLLWVTHSKFVFVAFGIEQAMHMHICGLSGTTIIPHYSIKEQFRDNILERKIRVLIFSTTSVRNILILKGNERDMIINVRWASCKVSVILVTC